MTSDLGYFKMMQAQVFPSIIEGLARPQTSSIYVICVRPAGWGGAPQGQECTGRMNNIGARLTPESTVATELAHIRT